MASSPTGPGPVGEEPEEFHTGPGPSRAAFLLAYAGVVLAGLLGAAIGFGLAEAGCHGDCGPAIAIAAVVGGVIAAAGVGVVAVLALRAMAEWRRPQPPKTKRRNPSA